VERHLQRMQRKVRLKNKFLQRNLKDKLKKKLNERKWSADCRKNGAS
jgi:hypothetical protein